MTLTANDKTVARAMHLTNNYKNTVRSIALRTDLKRTQVSQCLRRLKAKKLAHPMHRHGNSEGTWHLNTKRARNARRKIQIQLNIEERRSDAARAKLAALGLCAQKEQSDYSNGITLTREQAERVLAIIGATE